MPINKVMESFANAVEGVQDGATILVSGFGGAGMPTALLNALRDLIAQLGETPERLQLCATSALRDANNLPEICTRLQHELGLELTVLSGAEEAVRIREGLLQVHPLESGTVVLGDLGGGGRLRSARGVNLDAKKTNLPDTFA